MRIVVVLPLPLAPRKPQISPAATCSDRSSTTLCVPKPCADRARRCRRGHGAALRRAALRPAARGSAAGLVRRRPRLDKRTRAWPALLAVDDRRRVFGLRRDEGNGGPQIGTAAVAGERYRVAAMHAGTAPLSGTKKRTKILPAAAAKRPGRRRPSSRQAAPAHRRRARRPGGDAALRQAPLRHFQAGARRLDGGILRLDLRNAAERGAQLRERRLVGRDFRFGGTVLRGQLVHSLPRGKAVAQQGPAALQVRGGAHQRRARVRNVRFGLLNFCLLTATSRFASCCRAWSNCRAAWSRAARSAVSSCVNKGAPAATRSPRATATEVSSPGSVGPTFT